MAGSSPGSSSHLGMTNVEGETCAIPCTRIEGEYTVQVTKKLRIDIRGPQTLGVACFEESSQMYGRSRDISLENILRSLSHNAEVEAVEMSVSENIEAQGQGLQPLFECMKTILSLKYLQLDILDSKSLLATDAQAIFSLLVENKTLQSFTFVCDVNVQPSSNPGRVEFCVLRLSNPTVIAVLVDALLQNHFLQRFSFLGIGRYDGMTPTISKGIACDGGIVRELCRYCKAPNNALTHLRLLDLTDIQVQQVADMLRDNHQLKELWIERKRNIGIVQYLWNIECSKQDDIGVGNIGEALRNNTVLETLRITGTVIGVEEMKVLMGALVPNASSGRQPNTSLLDLTFSKCLVGPGGGEKEWMEPLTTMLRSNTSLTSLDLGFLSILWKTNKGSAEHAEMLFTSLWSNTSLGELDLRGCSGIKGKQMLGIIGDLLLHNHTLMKINLDRTGLNEDGDAGLVYAKLRARAKNNDMRLMKQLQQMERVPPNSARVFLCGSAHAGKTTLSRKWRHIFQAHEKGKTAPSRKWRHIFQAHEKGNVSFRERMRRKLLKYEFTPPDRTRGIEVHKMIWSGINVSVWDMAGQIEYHSFHDLVLPNQYANGGCCIYFIVCNPWEKEPQVVEDDIRYWLVFVVSNTRRTKSYRPRVTILMTHHDLWGNDPIRTQLLKESVRKLRSIFQHVLDFDNGFEFIEMDNKNQSHEDALRVKQNAEEYLKEMLLRMPKILKAAADLQYVVVKWNEEHSDKPILRWDEFSKWFCDEVQEMRMLKVLKGSNNLLENLLEKAKKTIASTLHDGGHIMYYEGLNLDIGGIVITNPHWFCHDVMGTILFKCSGLDPKYGITSNGVVTREHLRMICKDLSPSKGFSKRKQDIKKMNALILYIEEHFDEILSMMIKLQICYVDANDVTKIMIPAILSDTPTSALSWPYCAIGLPMFYKGTKLSAKDETITSMTTGFFPRFQVYLHNKYITPSYTLHFNLIYFIYKAIHIYITFMDGSINIMTRSHQKQHHDVHKMIITIMHDFRAEFSSLGCPGVIFEEHVIWPKCVEHCLSSKDPRFQSVPKKELKTMVLHCGDLEYTHHWKWDNHWRCAGADYAKDLLGMEEWEDILQIREQDVEDMNKRVDSMLWVTSNNGNQEASLIAPKEGLEDYGVCSGDSNVVMRKLASISRKMDHHHNDMKETMAHNHKEMMETLQRLESNIICSQQILITKVCSNIDKLMEFTLQLQNSKVPKVPYFLTSNKRQLLVKIIPGLKSFDLHFMCEYKGGFHIVEQQPGCTIQFGSNETRNFEKVVNMGLTIFIVLLKIGAHLGAGMGPIVPYPAQLSMIFLDTPGFLDLVTPSDNQLKFTTSGSLKEGVITDVEVIQHVTTWLVERLKSSRKFKTIYEMFKLTKMVYTHESNKKGEIAWVCDKHKREGEGDGTLQIVQESF